MTAREKWLVALDVDGTVLREDGSLGEDTLREVRRVAALGHEVMIATGRSVSMTLPVLDRLGLTSSYVVCANGAIVLGRDAAAPLGYTAAFVETFDPTEVLTTIRGHLEGASFAVEDADGVFRFTGSFPDGALAASRQKVPFEELLHVQATRVVVISPGHAIEDFLAVVERMGLHKVSYNVGWTAWLDIAPDGVNKATGLERVRGELAIASDRVLVIGDGRNDIDMLQWAVAGGGVGVAMGQAPDEVKDAANDRTASDLDDGVAVALARHFQG
ncbi:MAG TPA: HAD family hydrolase [Pseudolysinimonas sp.]|nr:HAD family hydrolase [Pseudolysinimonas sp.]